MQKLVNDEWVDCIQDDLNAGDVYRIPVGDGGWQQQTYQEPNKSDTERQWRDSEILRTDKLIVLPDYPIDLSAYRESLREYPQQPDFPDCDRPSI